MIDAHFHLWRIGENGCVWPTPEMSGLYRNFELPDITPTVTSLGIRGGILVQSQQADADTDYLLEIAENAEYVIAVCGWCDLAAPGAADRVRELSAKPKLKALRPMLQNIDNDRWLLDAPVAPAVRVMLDQGVVFDALIYERHLSYLLEFAQKYEGLRIVIDHGAKPQIHAGAFNEWAAGISAFKSHANVSCKISGLLTEAPKGAGRDAFKPYFEVLLETFGPERLMWGSDWPVVNLSADYRTWFDLAIGLCSELSQEEQQLVFAKTAENTYGLEGCIVT